MELMRTVPEWPMSFEMTKMFLLDMSRYYSIIEVNLDKVFCNIKYNGIIIKKDIFIKGVNFLMESKKR
jgi:hypothetical protein